MELEFSGPVFYWRGPAPFHFVAVPPDLAALVQENAAQLTYGWGMIPVAVRIGQTGWSTAMWPKDGGYVLPVKVWVRRAEGIELDDVVDVRLLLDL